MRFLHLLIVTLGICSCLRNSNQIFIAIFGKLPKSVQLLHSQDQQILDCCLWLHFSIDESDFHQLFDGYNLEKLDFQKWKYVKPPGLDWWKPSEIEGEKLYFEKTSEEGRLIEGIYTNSQRSEVYYVNYRN